MFIKITPPNRLPLLSPYLVAILELMMAFVLLTAPASLLTASLAPASLVLVAAPALLAPALLAPALLAPAPASLVLVIVTASHVLVAASHVLAIAPASLRPPHYL